MGKERERDSECLENDIDGFYSCIDEYKHYK